MGRIEGMTKTPKHPRDLNEWAKRMVDIATGEVVEQSQKMTEKRGIACLPDASAASVFGVDCEGFQRSLASQYVSACTSCVTRR